MRIAYPEVKVKVFGQQGIGQGDIELAEVTLAAVLDYSTRSGQLTRLKNRWRKKRPEFAHVYIKPQP